MKTYTESHTMRCAHQLLWWQARKAERVVILFEPGKRTRVEIHCTDKSVIPVVGREEDEMMRALRLDHEETKQTVAEIKALKRMEDLA